MNNRTVIMVLYKSDLKKDTFKTSPKRNWDKSFNDYYFVKIEHINSGLSTTSYSRTSQLKAHTQAMTSLEDLLLRYYKADKIKWGDESKRHL